MSAFTIKLIAMLSMLTDHAGYILMLVGRTRGDMYMLLRSIGRPAFVLFAFLIVNGCEKTSDMKRYLSRLVIFALVSQPAYSLAFTPENYRAPLFSAAPTAVQARSAPREAGSSMRILRPVSSRTRFRNSSPFSASLTADVATATISSTP